MFRSLFRRSDTGGPLPGPHPEPLDHPALQHLSLRDLADLPLPRPSR